MELLKAYREIEKRLEKIDFPALLRGFHRFPFALYDDTQAYLDGEYLGETRGFHEMLVSPAPGEHRLTVVDGDGQSRSVRFNGG